MNSPCRHCKLTRRIHRRGLCAPCYSAPRVRALYPPSGHNVSPSSDEVERLIAERLATMPASNQPGRV